MLVESFDIVACFFCCVWISHTSAFGGNLYHWDAFFPNICLLILSTWWLFSLFDIFCPLSFLFALALVALLYQVIKRGIMLGHLALTLFPPAHGLDESCMTKSFLDIGHVCRVQHSDRTFFLLSSLFFFSFLFFVNRVEYSEPNVCISLCGLTLLSSVSPLMKRSSSPILAFHQPRWVLSRPPQRPTRI